jgi:hypothetical protein
LRVQRTLDDDKTAKPDPTNQTPPLNTLVSADTATPTGTSTDSQGSTTIQDPTITRKSYSGATLADVANALPDESGSLEFDFTVFTQGDPATSATLKVMQVMTLPTWAERGKQCPEIQKAWDDFAAALRSHEDGHVAIDNQQFAAAHRRFVGKAASATQTESDQLRQDVQNAQDAYDTRTDHGRNGTPSTTIDLNAKCAEKKTSDLTPTETPDQMMAQSELTVGAPDDVYEQEADRIADEIMGMETPSSPLGLRRGLQRKQMQRCPCGGRLEDEEKQMSRGDSGDEEPMCAECRAKASKLRRKATDEVASRQPAAPLVDEVLASGGQPLDRPVRQFMEPRFGHDFSRVRIHTDERASQSAQAVNALAYTVGNNVVFSSGRYAPESTEGRRLLAHELAHVVQQGDAGDARRLDSSTILRAIDPSKGEPIRAELDSLIYVSNSNLESLWAGLGTDLPEAINDGTIVTQTPNEKTGKLESYRDLWWRSIGENISVKNAGQPVWNSFAWDSVYLARSYVSSKKQHFEDLVTQLKSAKAQNVSVPPPNQSTAGGVEDENKQMSRSTEAKPMEDARRLVDSATLLDFLLNWDELLKKSVVGAVRIDTSGLLPTLGPDVNPGTFNPFPNSPLGQGGTPGGTPGGAPSVSMPITFKPEQTADQILATPGLEVFDAEAFGVLQKTWRECSEKKADFEAISQRMMAEDANLAVLADKKDGKNLLRQVSALSGQPDNVAADTIVRVAQDNADAAQRFLDMLDSKPGEVWTGLGPIHAQLFAGGGGGRRDWSNIAAKGFVDAYFKETKEANEAAAQQALYTSLALNAVAFIAMLSPAAPLAAAFLTATEAYNAATALGSIAESRAAEQKADVLSKGAEVGVSDRDEARRAKEDADAKQMSMVFNVLTTALPYLGGVVRGGAKLAGALGREARWAGMASSELEEAKLAQMGEDALAAQGGPKGPIIGPTSGSAAQRASLMRELRTNLRSYWEKLTGGAPIAGGQCFLAADMPDATGLYEGMLTRDPAREAAIWRSATTGDIVVVQGQGNWVGGAVGRPNTTDRWIIIEHYHPERNFAVQFPSSADYDGLLAGYGGRGTGAIKSRIQSSIRYLDPTTSQWHFSYFGYDPALEGSPVGPFFLNIETKGGARVDLSFQDMNELQSLYGRLKAGEEIPR